MFRKEGTSRIKAWKLEGEPVRMHSRLSCGTCLGRARRGGRLRLGPDQNSVNHIRAFEFYL